MFLALYRIIKARFFSLNILSRYLLTMAGFWFYAAGHQAVDTVRLTIFIHGTVGSAFLFLDTQNVVHDRLNPHSRYVRMVNEFRNNPGLQQDQLLFYPGLHRWSPETPEALIKEELSAKAKKVAANFIIPVYECAQRHTKGVLEDRLYYMFGHGGFLSQTYRAKAALELYYALSDIYAFYKIKYKNVFIDIVAHSHGGNIALNLARCEDVHAKGLRVNNCILLGTPIQVETAACAYSSFFTRVINIYSEGDSIQDRDWMSTVARKSYKKFSDERLSIGRAKSSDVHDVRMLVNNNSRIVGHANMWLMGMQPAFCSIVHPLPLVVVVPWITSLVDAYSAAQLDCNIMTEEEQIVLTLSEAGSSTPLVCSPDIYQPLAPLLEAVHANWHPSLNKTFPILNARDRGIIFNTFKNAWFSPQKIKNELSAAFHCYA